MTTQFTQSPIPLIPMQQLAEAEDGEDDWTGLTDAAERRKRQTRLNMRAYRRRKAQELQVRKAVKVISREKPTQNETESMTPCWVEDQQAFNVLRASIANTQLLSPLQPTRASGCSSEVLHVLPATIPYPSTVPPSLVPTELQCTVPHESWVDIIPHPVWRDNVLRALGNFDEDDLWSDVIGGLFEGFPASEVERRGVIAWSPPWDASGWEISKGFWRKWGWSLRGCEEVLEATNRWRRHRGEEPLVFEDVDS
ncbi:hypothetical protein NKR23_g8671 [Pleurostoma richardsiae]|uniref:BZIP domain-containing protein n=1 Tax=Pleurostoma richardsiae TaxID=41990 RepID=A0AA38REF4_9PEZI|nr:hypothetical protein NKR23_g8671 [Pleurostoma richardsiae]